MVVLWIPYLQCDRKMGVLCGSVGYVAASPIVIMIEFVAIICTHAQQSDI